MHKRSLCPSKKVISFFHQTVFNRVAAASEAGFGTGSPSLAQDSWGLAQLNDPGDPTAAPPATTTANAASALLFNSRGVGDQSTLETVG